MKFQGSFSNIKKLNIYISEPKHNIHHNDITILKTGFGLCLTWLKCIHKAWDQQYSLNFYRHNQRNSIFLMPISSIMYSGLIGVSHSFFNELFNLLGIIMYVVFYQVTGVWHNSYSLNLTRSFIFKCNLPYTTEDLQLAKCKQGSTLYTCSVSKLNHSI